MALLDTLPPYFVGIAAGLLVFATLKRRASRRPLPLPPGPKPLPLIGNLLDIPTSAEWLTYQAWNERYGDVVYFEALGKRMVILGSAKAVKDLMERRSSVYSDRPQFIMLSELMDIGWPLPALPYGDTWRRGRRLFHSHVHPGVSPKYHPTQLHAARRFARDILKARQDDKVLHDMIHDNIGQTIVKVVYGIDVTDNASEYISLAQKIIAYSNDSVLPGRFLVEFMPFLKHIPTWLPGAGFQRLATKARIDSRRVRDDPIAFVQAGMANGTAPPSMARSMLEDDAVLHEGSEVDMIKDVTGITYLAGSDTTVTAVYCYFLAMLIWPDIQAKAQAEVDRVVGNGPLPEFDDAPRMPYVQGIINECLRWIPVVPMSIPHAVTRDDEYKGYFIPKGTIVMGAAWSVSSFLYKLVIELTCCSGFLHDPKDYPDPHTFNPDRYLTPDGKLDPSVRDPRIACFGFGRRACPGRHFAEANLFAMITTLLATVSIVRAKDAEGKDIIPSVEVTSGFFCHPKPFPWSVRPRSQHAWEMLEASFAS